MVQKNSITKKLIIICGPTASSKTSLAVAIAEKLNSEVISADSMNVYKRLNVGTAKPDVEEMKGIKHHLIDVVEPDEEFSVSDYKRLAKPVIDNLLSKGKIPIICGGTGFYINSLLYNFSYGKGKGDETVREKYKLLTQKNGNMFVYDILTEKDPETAKKLHPNDVKRVIRALEIFESGVKKSDIKDDMTPNYDYVAYSVGYSREELYNRIDKRVDVMFEKGLVEEVKRLIDGGITENHQCMQGIGYKEIFPYLNGELTLDQTKDLIKLNTRHYAKRQITFFNRLGGLKIISPSDPEKMAEKIIEEL